MRYLLAKMIDSFEQGLVPLFSSPTLAALLYLRVAIISFASIVFISFLAEKIQAQKQLKQGVKTLLIVLTIFLSVAGVFFFEFETDSQLWSLALLFFFAAFSMERNKFASWLTFSLVIALFIGWFFMFPLI